MREKHFLSVKIYRLPSGIRKSLIQEARSILHPWNNFISFEKHQKKPSKQSPRKKVKMADCRQQQDDKQQDLCETDDNIQLDDSPVDLKKKNNQDEALLTRHL